MRGRRPSPGSAVVAAPFEFEPGTGAGVSSHIRLKFKF